MQHLERMVRPAGPPPVEDGVGSGQMIEWLERMRFAEEMDGAKCLAARNRRAMEELKTVEK